MENKRTIGASLVFIAAELAFAPAAAALQPLEVFITGARSHHPLNRESRANSAAAEAQASVATARALPTLSAGGSYTRNQWEVGFAGRTVLPRDQWEAAVTLSVPLVDLAKFARIGAADRAAEALVQQEHATGREVEAQVVQLYYQLAADLALVGVARKALEVVEVDLRLTEEAAGAGTAGGLDVARARAEVEQRRQQLTSAELQVSLTAQVLTSRTGIEPDAAAPPELTDDLHTEPALAEFLAGVAATPTVKAAALARLAAERRASAQRLALVPTLAGGFTERFTNATGFLNGHHAAYAATVSLGWTLDFGTAPAIRAGAAEKLAARAREEAARLAVVDAIVNAFRTIEADLIRSRSARVRSAAAAKAADIARSRYRAGVSTQLDLIQADRDAFAAEASRIQADSDLLNARRQLRLAAGSGAP